MKLGRDSWCSAIPGQKWMSLFPKQVSNAPGEDPDGKKNSLLKILPLNHLQTKPSILRKKLKQ